MTKQAGRSVDPMAMMVIHDIGMCDMFLCICLIYVGVAHFLYISHVQGRCLDFIYDIDVGVTILRVMGVAMYFIF